VCLIIAVVFFVLSINELLTANYLHAFLYLTITIFFSVLMYRNIRAALKRKEEKEKE
jgi:hypothetical protein